MKDTIPQAVATLALQAGQAPRVYALHVIGATVPVVPLVPGATIRIGRQATSDIVIPHPSASREHAFVYAGQPPEIEDLGSSNGTRVQGNRIPARSRVPLALGSIIEIAGTLIHVRSVSAGTQPPDADVRGSLASASDKKRGPVLQDRRMNELYALAQRVATSAMSVLVLGETGVGKELLTERIHAASPRKDRPFLKVNCAAFAEGVLASELFGHEKGAFTGATVNKAGLFESATGGTLFLDEIGELSLETQAKLLRVLETGEIARVGSHQPRQVDVRVVSATNRDLRQLIGQGRFRADLFYRLNGVSLTIPPLRERTDDIMPLALCFAERCAAMMGVPVPLFAEDARALLLRYRWPGNVRELKNAIERAVVLTHSPILDAGSLQLDFGAPTTPPSFSSSLPSSSSIPSFDSTKLPAETRFASAHPHDPRDGPRPPSLPAPDPARDSMFDRGAPRSTRGASRLRSAKRTEQLRAELHRAERDKILEALEQAGNQAAAAKLLGISRRALIYRLEAFDIPRPRKGTKVDDSG